MMHGGKVKGTDFILFSSHNASNVSLALPTMHHFGDKGFGLCNNLCTNWVPKRINMQIANKQINKIKTPTTSIND